MLYRISNPPEQRPIPLVKRVWAALGAVAGPRAGGPKSGGPGWDSVTPGHQASVIGLVGSEGQLQSGRSRARGQHVR